MLVPIDEGRPIPLEKAVVLFGRGADCDVVITTSNKVSRKHCCLAQIDNHFVVRDLGSLNGIRVNSQQIKSESRINVGDELWVGDVGYHFVPLDAAIVNAPAKKPAAEKKKKKPTRPIDPKLLSQDIPVALPDEDEDFRVEESMPVRTHRDRIPDSQIIELADDDVVSDDEIVELGDDDIIEER
jgi:predicted component of type VI protein secretion system